MSENPKRNDAEIPAYTLPPQHGSMRVYRCPEDDDRLGEVRKVEVFETEHHVYTSPFRYQNVTVDGWLAGRPVRSIKGLEMLADAGSIVIEEDRPIVAVTVVGSGCAGNNYNIVEWWGPGEHLRDTKTRNTQFIKRQRVENLKGQHNSAVQKYLAHEPPEFKTVKDAQEYIQRMQDAIHNVTSGFYMPGSLMTGLYENTAYFRIGDTGRPEHTPYRVVIRGGGLDYEDPGRDRSRYPADYTFRLVDLEVKK